MLMESRASEAVRSNSSSSLAREHEGLVRNLKAIENSYGIDMLTLAVSLKYVERIVANPAVKEYLQQIHPETFTLLSGLSSNTLEAIYSAA
jgi:murein endopeptidase